MHNRKYSLIIIDMQPSFLSNSQRRVKENCAKLIASAKKDKSPIIFVEYSYSGKTIPSLLDEAKFAKRFFVTKDDDDGSFEIESCIRDNKITSNHIKVAGVNTECCVYATVKGLVKRFPHSTIEVISSACDSMYSHKTGLSSMKKYMPGNVVLS